MKLHAALAEYILACGVDAVFGLVGDGNLFFVDHYAQDGRGRYIGVAHESTAVLAALGYAQVSGRVGVATVTYGPGFTNTVTSLIAGARARTPIVLIAGDTPSVLSREQKLMNVSQASIAAVAEASVVQLQSAETWHDDIRRAFALAEERSRPVVLNVPVDLMWANVAAVKAQPWQVSTSCAHPREDDLDAALGAIASARRPLVLAGRGAEQPGARSALIELADLLGAPLFTTFQARGLFAGEKYACGVFGGLATIKGASVMAASDCVISFGASLNAWTTEHDDLIRGKTVIVCDDNPERARSDIPNSFLVGGDAEVVARSMLTLLKEAEVEATNFREQADHESDATPPATGPWGIRSAVALVHEMLPRDRIIVTDAGRFLEFVYRAVLDDSRQLVSTHDFGSIGMGMGYAIGAAVAAPDSHIALVTGDGGHMLGGYTELTTAIRCGLNLTVVVLNDQSYGAEYIQFEARGMDPSSSVYEWPDFAAATTAAGGAGFRATSQEELRRALEADVSRRPRLIDVRLDPATIGDPRVTQ